MAVKPSERPIEKEPYYHGVLQREDLSEMLKNEGDFLVRMSLPSEHDRMSVHIVSVCYNNKTLEESTRNKHLVIRISKGKYMMKNAFESIPQLIDYFVKTQEPISENTFLTVPINRQNWELTHESITTEILIGGGKYEGNTTCLGKYRSGRSLLVHVEDAHLYHLTTEQLKDFLAEARVMRAVYQHPNVLWFYGIAAGQNPMYLVTEITTDGPLDEYLQKNPDIPQYVRDTMCLQAAWGLEYIHKKNYLHRDVQTRSCQYHLDKVKISDFRQARQGNSYQMNTDQPVPSRWLAPETIKSHIYTQKTDVWSYGVFCWEVYNNASQPYPGLTDDEVRVKVPEGHRMSIPGTDSEFATMIMTRCWADNQNDRYTMSEVCTDLEDVTWLARPDVKAYYHGRLNYQLGIDSGKKDREKKKNELLKIDVVRRIKY